MNRKRIIILMLIIGPSLAKLSAQSYDPHRAFSPIFYSQNGTSFRSADGAPGPSYWQNRADYFVEALFDTASREVSGTVRITYTNNSPDSLPFLWLELDQNINRQDSRARAASQPLPHGKDPNGFRIQGVETGSPGHWIRVPYLITDTRMQVRLPRALPGRGGKIQLLIPYRYQLLPRSGGGRSGYLDTRNGRIYEFSYWYPRLCVYDDLAGWNILPFLGQGEFYMDYGTIDYRVSVPSGMLVMGSGELLNSREVLTDQELRRLTRARQSDQRVIIRGPGDLERSATRRDTGYTTWHFVMNHTRDVAWALSSAFLWDAARINLPAGKKALAMSVYPEESAGDSSWGRATEYLKNAVEIFSRKWYPYPYPVAINVGGRVGGMEYPGITFDSWHARGKSLWAVLAHEIGHNWFPMIVGSNERKFAWMDEGFNTFIDIYASREFNHGEYAPKRDGEYAPHGGKPADEIVPFITRPGIPTIMTEEDGMDPRVTHPLEYFKTAFGLVLLREIILGHKRFDFAFRQYIRDWAYKHPFPWDFFREMDNGSGEDLSWFWKGWFLHNWVLDQAISRVIYRDGDPAKGALITLKNLGQMVMPVLIRIREENGKELNLKLPVEIWQRGALWTFRAPTTEKLVQVRLDPDHLLPDADRSNNTWTP